MALVQPLLLTTDQVIICFTCQLVIRSYGSSSLYIALPPPRAELYSDVTGLDFAPSTMMPNFCLKWISLKYFICDSIGIHCVLSMRRLIKFYLMAGRMSRPVFLKPFFIAPTRTTNREKPPRQKDVKPKLTFCHFARYQAVRE